jgi:hypothetical protein
MNKRDTTGPLDQDVEGHKIYAGSDRTIKDHVEPVAWEGDEDTEGHGVRVRLVDADTAEGDDDVEGHRSYSSSDRTIKDQVEPVAWEDDEDTEGHRFSSSDRTIKDHVEPVAWEGDEGDEDTEGHGARFNG